MVWVCGGEEEERGLVCVWGEGEREEGVHVGVCEREGRGGSCVSV